MNKGIIAVVFVLSVFTLRSQNQRMISYFDKNGHLTFVDSAFYYREETDTINFYRSFYTLNKRLYFEGKILSAKDTSDVGNTYSGLCTWYYINGVKKRQCIYNENGVLDGLSEEFYKDGKIFKQILYESGKVDNNQYVEYSTEGIATNIFEENFINNDNNWDLLKTENFGSKIKIGGLELSNTTKHDYVISIPHQIDSANFSIETIINSRYLVPDCKSGLVFGFKDNKNYNYFFVSSNRFYVGTIKNGVNSIKADSYFSPDLNVNDWNRLKMVCSNDSFYYYINDKLQIYCHKEEMNGFSIGFQINNGVSFFDKLVIKQYSKELQGNDKS